MHVLTAFSRESLRWVELGEKVHQMQSEVHLRVLHSMHAESQYS